MDLDGPSYRRFGGEMIDGTGQFLYTDCECWGIFEHGKEIRGAR